MQNPHNGRIVGPRFVIKFVNGIWTIFDRVTFTNCEPDLGTRKFAEGLLNKPARGAA